MILHELEMQYLHDYLTLLSAKILDLTKNYFHNNEEIRSYEDKLMELLSLIYYFFSLEICQENFLPTIVVYSDELFQLLIYSDNFDLIAQIMMCLKIRVSYPSYCFLRMKYQNKYILSSIEKFLFANKESNYISYYEFFLKTEKFAALRKETDRFFDYKISDKPNFEDSENLNITLTLKKENSSETETKKIQVKHLMSIYHSDKPSAVIAQQILAENQISNLLENDIEPFVMLVYSIKYLKLQSDPKKAFHHVTLANILAGLRDTVSWNFDSNGKYYSGYDAINYRSHLIYFHAPGECLDDEQTLKKLLISFCYYPVSNAAYCVKSPEKNYFSFFSKKISEISTQIQERYSENYEIISLVLEQLIYGCFRVGSSFNFKSEPDYFSSVNNFLEIFFEKYYVKNEKFQKDPVEFLCDPHFKRLTESLISIMNSDFINYLPKKQYFFDEISKIIEKMFETLLVTNQTYEEIVQKYPNILVLESLYEKWSGIILSSYFSSKKENIKKVFHELFQKCY